jgi:hypothetical protein
LMAKNSQTTSSQPQLGKGSALLSSRSPSIADPHPALASSQKAACTAPEGNPRSILPYNHFESSLCTTERKEQFKGRVERQPTAQELLEEHTG